MKFLRFVGKRGCRARAYGKALSNDGTVVLDSLSSGSNITIRFQLDGHPVNIPISPNTRDFLDFAAGVFIADELVARRDSNDGWTRSFDFILPVHRDRTWARQQDSIAALLSHLTGDRFIFEFHKRGRIPNFGRHRLGLPRKVDSVCLFSGGLDSLLGAYQLLSAGERVLLVGHQADGITASAQKDLAGRLSKLFPEQVYLIQCRVARSQATKHQYTLPDKMEESHRPRSFLFLAIATTIAKAVGCRKIYIPENGLIALNSPLQKSRVGTLSTRTAHPKYLSLFSDCVRALNVFSGEIKNPFIYESKTDVLQRTKRSLRPLIRRTISCAHAGDVRWTGADARHCGYCVPCLYRRVALMGPGLDDPKDYAFDVFGSLKDLTTHRQSDFRALIAFAKRVTTASDAERHMMVLAHGLFDPKMGGKLGPYATTDYAPWAEMLKRWATDFVAKARLTSSRATRRIVGI